MEQDKFKKYYIKYEQNQDNHIYKEKLDYYMNQILSQNGGDSKEILELINKIKTKNNEHSKIVKQYNKDIIGKVNSLISNYELIYENIKKDNEEQIDNIKEEIDGYKKQIKTLMDDSTDKDLINELENKVKVSDNKIKSTEDELTKMTDLNNKYEQDIEKLKNQIKTLSLDETNTNKIAELETKIKNKTSEILLLEKKNKDNDTEIDKLKNQIKTLSLDETNKNKITELETKIKDKTNEISLLEKKNKDNDAEIEKLKNQIKTLSLDETNKNKITELETKIKILETKSNTVTKDIEKYINENKLLQTNESTNKTKIKELEEKIKTRIDEIKSLTDKNKELEEKIAQYKKTTITQPPDVIIKSIKPEIVKIDPKIPTVVPAITPIIKKSSGMSNELVMKVNEIRVKIEKTTRRELLQKIQTKEIRVHDTRIRIDELIKNVRKEYTIVNGLLYFIECITLLEGIDVSSYDNKYKNDYIKEIGVILKGIVGKYVEIYKVFNTMNLIKEAEKKYKGVDLYSEICSIFGKDDNIKTINKLIEEYSSVAGKLDDVSKDNIKSFMYRNFYAKFVSCMPTMSGGELFMFSHDKHYDLIDSTPYFFDKYYLISENINNLVQEATINLYELFKQYYNFIKNYNEDINDIIKHINKGDKNKINIIKFDYPDFKILEKYNFAPKDVVPIVDIMKTNFNFLLEKLEELKKYI